MESCASQNFADCQLGDKRLTKRALEIGQALVTGFGARFINGIPRQESPETSL